MLCPSCDNTQLTMSERQGIEIDYCPKCRGVWLDRGELDKIIERSTMESQTVAHRRGTDSPDGHRYGAEYHGGKQGSSYRKKSFWSEIFD